MISLLHQTRLMSIGNRDIIVNDDVCGKEALSLVFYKLTGRLKGSTESIMGG